MIWNLLLAHFLADYPLQPMWLVRSKSHTWGLVLHAAIHFFTTMLLVGAARMSVWPQVLALALFHFVVDVVKYRLGEARPAAVTLPYFIDQAIHIASIIVVAGWIGSVAPSAPGLLDPQLAIYGIGILLASHVWFVTEKTIAHANPEYLTEVEDTLWSRMAARTGLLAVLLFAAPAFVAAAVQLPYQKELQWQRALVTDVAVAAGVAVLVRLFLALPY